MADQHDLAARRRGGARPPRAPWRPAGRWRRGRASCRASRLRRHRLGHAVGGEHHRPVGGALVQLLDEHRAQRLQPLDHVAVVDDLVAHIDRRAVLLDRPLDDLDRPVDAGAEAARRWRAALKSGRFSGGGMRSQANSSRGRRGLLRRRLRRKLSRPDADCLGAGVRHNRQRRKPKAREIRHEASCRRFARHGVASRSSPAAPAAAARVGASRR